MSISFATAAPFSKNAEEIYQKYKKALYSFQKDTLHPKDKVLDTVKLQLIIGMGRVGTGAYRVLEQARPGKFLE